MHGTHRRLDSKETSLAVVLSLLSSLLWGGADFLGGMVSRRFPAMVVVGWSAAVGLLMSTVVVLLVEPWHQPIGWLPWGAAAGAAGALGLISYYLALATGTMGVVAPVTSLGVVVPVIVGFIAGETPSAVVLVGMGVAIVGIVFTSGPEFTGGASATPVLIAVLAGLCFGIFFVFADHGSEDSALLTLWAMRATAAAGFVAVAMIRRTTEGSNAEITAGSQSSRPVTSVPTCASGSPRPWVSSASPVSSARSSRSSPSSSPERS
ncbi:MAG: DMT family transporter [Nocardioidaceae bacterium]